jgi:hypothetical protein
LLTDLTIQPLQPDDAIRPGWYDPNYPPILDSSGAPINRVLTLAALQTGLIDPDLLIATLSALPYFLFVDLHGVRSQQLNPVVEQYLRSAIRVARARSGHAPTV